MEDKVGFNFISNLNELIGYYDEELSNKKLFPSTMKNSLLAWIALSALFIGIVLFFIMLVTASKLLSIIAPTLLFCSSGFMLLLLKTRKKSLEFLFNNDNMRHYLTLANKKSSEYEYDILLAYRADKIADKLNDMGISNTEYITGMIGHLETKSQNIMNKKWLPVSITGLFLFVFWTEFIGKTLDLTSVLFLLILGLLISWVVVLLNSGMKIFLWSEAGKFQDISTIMKITLTSR